MRHPGLDRGEALLHPGLRRGELRPRFSAQLVVYRASNPAPVFPGDTGMAISPTSKFIYLSSRSPFGFSSTAHIVVDASGHFLYATYLFSPIEAYSIDQKTGALSAIAGGPSGMGDLAILK